MLNYFKPTRAAEKPEDTDVKIVCDFDAMISQSVGFKFQNRFYKLSNVDVKNYMEVTLAYRDLLQMASSRSEGIVMTQDEIYMKYFNLIHPLVPDFKYESIKKLPFVLLNQLVTLILRQLAGDPELFKGNSEEKKNPLIHP